jgi:hypothetical protein
MSARRGFPNADAVSLPADELVALTRTAVARGGRVCGVLSRLLRWEPGQLISLVDAVASAGLRVSS